MTFVSLAILYSSIIPIGLFIGFYGLRSNWRATSVGKILMGIQFCIFLIMAAGLVNFIADPAWFDIMRMIVYPATALGFWSIWLELLKVQRRSREECRRRAAETD